MTGELTKKWFDESIIHIKINPCPNSHDTLFVTSNGHSKYRHVICITCGFSAPYESWQSRAPVQESKP